MTNQQMLEHFAVTPYTVESVIQSMLQNFGKTKVFLTEEGCKNPEEKAKIKELFKQLVDLGYSYWSIQSFDSKGWIWEIQTTPTGEEIITQDYSEIL